MSSLAATSHFSILFIVDAASGSGVGKENVIAPLEVCAPLALGLFGSSSKTCSSELI